MAMSFWKKGRFGKRFGVSQCIVVFLSILLAVLLFGTAVSPATAYAPVWEIDTVDSAGYVGWYTSIALDDDGFPHISYIDGGGNFDLKYAKWAGSAWNIKTVDSAGDVGEYTSIALDADGYPHISYHDNTNDDLKYAKWTGARGT